MKKILSPVLNIYKVTEIQITIQTVFHFMKTQ